MVNKKSPERFAIANWETSQNKFEMQLSRGRIKTVWNNVNLAVKLQRIDKSAYDVIYLYCVVR